MKLAHRISIGTLALAMLAALAFVRTPPVLAAGSADECEDWVIYCSEYAEGCGDEYYDVCYAECLLYDAWSSGGVDCGVCDELDVLCGYYCEDDEACISECIEGLKSDFGLTCEAAPDQPDQPSFQPRQRPDCPTCKIFSLLGIQ